jgi:hypothetical protein
MKCIDHSIGVLPAYALAKVSSAAYGLFRAEAMAPVIGREKRGEGATESLRVHGAVARRR